MSLEGKGFEELAYAVDAVEGRLKQAVETAMTAAQREIQADVDAASAKYVPGGTKYSTGAMRASIKKPDGVKWDGTAARIGVGFNIPGRKGGGLHSIFIMYGTPRMSANRKLYAAIRGAATARRVRQAIADAMGEALKLDSASHDR